MDDEKISVNRPANTKVTAGRQKKIDIVSGLNEKLASAKAIVFTNYQGLTHKQLETLKKAIKPMNAEFVVAKNTLVIRAMGENNIKVGDEKQFEGPTGTLLMQGDVVGPLRSLAKLIKELGIPSVKFGIIDGDILNSEQILKLSTLPSKEVLLTQVAISLKSPILGLHSALTWNLQKLVMTLGAIVKSKPADAADAKAQPVSEAKTEKEEATAETIQSAEPAQETAPVSEPEPESILAEIKVEEKV